jgi:hypothetical protein
MIQLFKAHGFLLEQTLQLGVEPFSGSLDQKFNVYLEGLYASTLRVDLANPCEPKEGTGRAF